VVGLGVGTLAAWGVTGDTVRFYEINPAVPELADSFFTFMRNSQANVSVVLGDARLTLEREDPQLFDMLILDAFNSDSPPVHLLTREAFATYLRHLKPGGAIAINMTCKYLNFFPVVARLAQECALRWAYIHDANAEEAFYRSSSTWMVLSNNAGLMNNAEFSRVCTYPRTPYASFPLWTDDYSSLAPILTW
jgi:spermidine synthase